MPQNSPPIEPSKTIDQFCEAEGISRSKYFGMRRFGFGPDELRDGKVVRITPEAHRRWRKRHTISASKVTSRHRAVAEREELYPK